MSERSIRLAGIAGVVFVVMILVTVFSTGSMPMSDDSPDKIRAFLVDHRGALLASNLIGMLAVPFVLWFGVMLRELLRGDRLSSALGTFSLAGLLVTAPMAAAGGATSAVAVYNNGVAAKLGDDTVRTLFTMQALFFTATAMGIIAFAVGAAIAISRTKALPAYTMWLACLAVVGNVVSAFASLGAGASGLGFPGVLTFALFILVTGITMAMGKAAPAAAAG